MVLPSTSKLSNLTSQALQKRLKAGLTAVITEWDKESRHSRLSTLHQKATHKRLEAAERQSDDNFGIGWG